jgi:hypothetical protein
MNIGTYRIVEVEIPLAQRICPRCLTKLSNVSGLAFSAKHA